MAQLRGELLPDDVRVVRLRSVAELRPYVAAWQALASTSLEPNPFYEPWLLLPAWEILSPHAPVEALLVLRGPEGPRAEACAFLPLVTRKSLRGVPLPVRVAWRYDHCYLTTPLVRREGAVRWLAALLAALASDYGDTVIVELGRATTDGPFHDVLQRAAAAAGGVTAVAAQWSRALLSPADLDAESYLDRALSAKVRKDLRRKRRRLEERGKVEVVELSPGEDVELWAEAFLSLEDRGWKRDAGTSLNATAEGRAFFREVVRGAAAAGRLMMVGLRVDGRFVSLLVNFVTPPGSFAFKTAYDPELAPCSPGALLEVENIHSVVARGDLEWMDSCAASDHALMNRLWTEEREMATVYVGTGGLLPRLLVSSIPTMRRAKQRLRAALTRR